MTSRRLPSAFLTTLPLGTFLPSRISQFQFFGVRAILRRRAARDAGRGEARHRASRDQLCGQQSSDGLVHGHYPATTKVNGGLARRFAALQLAMLDRDPRIAMGKRAVAMGDDDRGGPGRERAQAIDQRRLRRRIERCGGFVEDDEAGIAEQRAGDQQPLPLAARQAAAMLAQRVSEAAGERADPVRQADIRAAPASIPRPILRPGRRRGWRRCCRRTPARPARHTRGPRASGRGLRRSSGCAIDPRRPSLRLKEAAEQIGQGRLARRRGAVDPEPFAARDGELRRADPAARMVAIGGAAQLDPRPIERLGGRHGGGSASASGPKPPLDRREGRCSGDRGLRRLHERRRRRGHSRE